MKKILATLIFLSAIGFSSFAQQSIVIRIIEGHATGVSKLIMTDENGSSSSIPLKPVLFDASFEGALKANQEMIQSVMNQILEDGFSLKSMSTDSKDVLYTLMVFTKD